ncbi:MAG: hypothetical protein FJ271_31305 [Planctomycetes bacterium]|nr:hypothetical protein [Planctomycetota bacterium]
MISAYLEMPPRDLREVAPDLAGTLRTVWINLYARSGEVQAGCHVDEGEALQEIADAHAGHGWLGWRYVSTTKQVDMTSVTTDRLADALEYDREQMAEARLDAQHARGCMHPGA